LPTEKSPNFIGVKIILILKSMCLAVEDKADFVSVLFGQTIECVDLCYRSQPPITLQQEKKSFVRLPDNIKFIVTKIASYFCTRVMKTR